MKKFDDTKAWNLPVINEEGKYKGFVSKSKIFNSYRQVLVVSLKINNVSIWKERFADRIYGYSRFCGGEPERLVEGGYNVVGVITMPDKPMGRHGSVLQPSPVKEYAVSQGLRILQPEK